MNCSTRGKRRQIYAWLDKPPAPLFGWLRWAFELTNILAPSSHSTSVAEEGFAMTPEMTACTNSYYTAESELLRPTLAGLSQVLSADKRKVGALRWTGFLACWCEHARTALTGFCGGRCFGWLRVWSTFYFDAVRLHCRGWFGVRGVGGPVCSELLNYGIFIHLLTLETLAKKCTIGQRVRNWANVI